MAFVFDFTRIKNRAALIDTLGTDEVIFQHVLLFEPPPPARERPPRADTPTTIIDIPAFFRHDIPKKNRARGHRTVWEPFLTKNVYKALARRLDNFFSFTYPGYPHHSAFGYRAGRNIKQNAAAHTGHRFRLSVDIENFFPSITREMVASTLRLAGVHDEISDLLARFLTIGDLLPLGLPTSPVISNVIAVPLDEALSQLAEHSGSTYTRYSDDITFSGVNELPDLEIVKDILAKKGFRIATSKTRQSKIGQGHYVTGLSISDPVRPHVPRHKKRSLRQELYYTQKYGLHDHLRRRGMNDDATLQSEINRLDGTIKFVAHHEPGLSTSIKGAWREILVANGLKPSFTPRGLHQAPFHLLVDEAEYKKGGKTILALCIVMTQHVDRIADGTDQVLQKSLNDVWSDGSTEALKRRGLHFTDATEDLKLSYIKELAKMPIEGYVAFCEYDGPGRYEEAYLNLLTRMITRRLMAAESQFAFFYFEQNSKVSTAKITQCVEQAYAELKATNNRRPAAMSVKFIGKPHPALSPPDFLLGLLGRYLASKPPLEGKAEPRERLLFERVRDKYRLILDLTADIEFSRRNPIKPWHD